MHRRSLIKCILGLAAAPKILADMEFKPPIVAAPTANLFKDLVLTVPDYIPKLLEKYGNSNWALTADEFNATWNKAQLNYFEDIIQRHGDETKNT